jgi:hypothetical protein
MREEGYYWVKWEGEYHIAQYIIDEDKGGGHWGLTFCDEWISESEFTEIDERQIKRDE